MPFSIASIQTWIRCLQSEFVDWQLVEEMEKMGERQLWEVVRWCKIGLWCLGKYPAQQLNIKRVLQVLKEGDPINLPQDSTFRDYLSSIPMIERVNLRWNLTSFHAALRFDESYIIVRLRWTDLFGYEGACSLYDHIHRAQSLEMALQWSTRYEIAISAALMLSYMHHRCSPPIWHRNVKSSNILLDSAFHPKIVDFELCRVTHNLDDAGYVGCHAYIAPEDANSLKVSLKSDVYSFGVLLLELVSGKKATGEVEFGKGVDIVGWIHSTLSRGEVKERALDWRMNSGDCVDEQVKTVLQLGLLCTQSSPEDRPSMRDVVEMLVV